MNSKSMLFECLGDCKETYLADNLCDGYKCPKCNGHIIARGFIKELEENAKDMQDKINRAKENGLIRRYNRHLNHVPFDGYVAAIPFDKYLCGVDLSDKKDFTVTVSFNAEEFNEDLKSKLIEVLEEHKRNIGNYIQCKYE